MTIDEGINPKLQMHRLAISSYLTRLRMDPVKSNEALKICLNPLGLTAPNIDTELHKTRGVQLVKLEIEPFQHPNNKRMHRKPQTSQEELLINNNLIIMRVRNSFPLIWPCKISGKPTSLREVIQVTQSNPR
jgi:hypothetical protein